jgi:hypothetical protein
MEPVLSVTAILSSLEAQITEQRAQEAFYRGSRERHAAAGAGHFDAVRYHRRRRKMDEHRLRLKTR